MYTNVHMCTYNIIQILFHKQMRVICKITKWEQNDVYIIPKTHTHTRVSVCVPVSVGLSTSPPKKKQNKTFARLPFCKLVKVPVDKFKMVFFQKNLVQIPDCICKLTPKHHFSRPFFHSLHQNCMRYMERKISRKITHNSMLRNRINIA